MDETDGGARTNVSKHTPVRGPNPLLVKELRSRMRGVRAVVILTVYLLLMGCLASLVYLLAVEGSAYSGVADTSDIGKAVFYTIVVLEILMAALVTPSLTAGSISGERERKTYEMLRTTLLPARKLVYGKLGSALIYIMLLVLVATPLKGLAFMLGGVTPGEFVLALELILMTSLAFGTIGLFFSSITHSSRASMALTNTVVLLLLLGLPIAALISESAFGLLAYGYGYGMGPSWAEELSAAAVFILLCLSPPGAAVLSAVILAEDGSYWTYDLLPTLRLPSGWIVFTAAYLLLTGLLLLLAISRVRRQDR
jgi:ABC-type transport system involved in multi-copper enzyme maturation permease subunit